jgi:hypothetical protein
MNTNSMPTGPLRRILPGASLFLLTLTACGAPPATEDDAAIDATVNSADAAAISRAFLANLASHCGEAFPGGLTLEPPGDDMLRGDELLLVHFRECPASGDTVRIPFHIEAEPGEWNRSRTWILTLADDGGLELRHDHREPDGSPSEVTFYGGFSDPPGTAIRQDFTSAERTESSGFHRGWRIEIEPGVRYTYGTTRRGEWSWRIDFDLTTPVDPPPAPWGHE